MLLGVPGTWVKILGTLYVVSDASQKWMEIMRNGNNGNGVEMMEIFDGMEMEIIEIMRWDIHSACKSTVSVNFGLLSPLFPSLNVHEKEA